MLKRLAFFITFFLFVTPAYGKDLSQRLGVGFSNQFSIDMPAVTMHYYPGPKYGLSGAVGLDTQEDNSKFGFMAKLYRIVFQEENMNFYMGTGAALISEETAGDNESGFELNGFVGVQFFFAGLENLGLSFETGIGVTSISSEVRFRTIGDSPFMAGMIFYF